jgi:hypothetical protein
VDFTRAVTRLVPFGVGAVVVDWDSSEDASVPVASLDTAPRKPADFGSLPSPAAKAASYPAWAKEYARWLQQAQVLNLFFDDETGTLSNPDEQEAAFRARLDLARREKRDADRDELRADYAPRATSLDDKIRRAQVAEDRERGQRTSQVFQTAVSVGSSVLGMLLGRKAISVTNIGRATTAARGVGRVMKEQDDVSRASGSVSELQQQKADLESELQTKLADLEAKAQTPARTLASITVKPTPARIAVDRVLLVWVPQ